MRKNSIQASAMALMAGMRRSRAKAIGSAATVVSGTPGGASMIRGAIGHRDHDGIGQLRFYRLEHVNAGTDLKLDIKHYNLGP